MPRLRVYRVVSTVPPPRLRIMAVSGSGPAVVNPRLRVRAVSGSGTLAAVLKPVPDQTVEPQITVTVTAESNGALVSNTMWRQISGPTVTITPSGSTATTRSVSIVTPSAMPPGTDVVLGVTLVVGAQTSAERTATVHVLPQTEWSRTYGGDWTAAPMSQP